MTRNPSGPWKTALYLRLSRDDGDRPDRDSIATQRSFLESYLSRHPDLQPAGIYTDDGYTGTNFDRPQFQALWSDIQQGLINCVVVKDLSRFGRDYIDTGYYLERRFPECGVRFIAVNDHIDSIHGPYDILLPIQNVFNEQYARDISRKVRSAIRTKQRSGAFIGAFPCYGYRKDPHNHNQLLIDPCAAEIVARIFDLFEQGMGKLGIAKTLNREGIPCPSVYKRLNGERYHNGQRLGNTTYWTYATIHRILGNQMYIGNMEQGRAPRQTMHGRAKPLDRGQWIVVPHTHEAIIQREQWQRVQHLLHRHTRSPAVPSQTHPLSGFLQCGDCGRAMSRVSRSDGPWFCCGSYKRYGPTVCSRHSISCRELERILLDDLNRVLATVDHAQEVSQESRSTDRQGLSAEKERLSRRLQTLYRRKKTAYEDYQEQLIGREDYLRYREEYEQQEKQVMHQLEQLQAMCAAALESPPLLQQGKLVGLDRITLAETVSKIVVYQNQRIQIIYRFAEPPTSEAGSVCRTLPFPHAASKLSDTTL